MIPLTPPSPARGEGVIGLFSDRSVLWILEEGVGREDEEKLGRP
jgi:hypothetical protein